MEVLPGHRIRIRPWPTGSWWGRAVQRPEIKAFCAWLQVQAEPPPGDWRCADPTNDNLDGS